MANQTQTIFRPDLERTLWLDPSANPPTESGIYELLLSGSRIVWYSYYKTSTDSWSCLSADIDTAVEFKDIESPMIEICEFMYRGLVRPHIE